MKIIINRGIGPFRLSQKVLTELKRHECKSVVREKTKYSFRGFDIDSVRYDPLVIKTVEKIGPVFSGDRCILKVVDIPEGVSYYIHSDNNKESVHESHRVWD